MFAEYAGDWRSADFDFTNCGLDSAADGPAEAELSRSRLRAARSSSSSFRSRELRASESGRSSGTFDGPGPWNAFGGRVGRRGLRKEGPSSRHSA